MSHDLRSPSDAADAHDNAVLRGIAKPFAAKCETCGYRLTEATPQTTEIFELTGQLLCDDCAEAAFEALAEDGE